MTWTNDFRLYAIEVKVVGMSSPLYISGLTDGSIEANSEILRETVAGTLFAPTASLQTVKPVANFTSLNLPQALDAFGLGGAASCITSDGTHPGVNFYFAKQACAGAAAGAVHRKYTVSQGIVVPTRLNVTHRGNATIAYAIHTSYDGTNNPVILTENVALPAANLAGDPGGRWTMDAMVIGAVAIEGKRDISIDFQANIQSEGADSNAFDTSVSLRSILQNVKVSGVDPSWFTSVSPLLGVGVSDLNTTWIYKKRNVELTVAEHVKLIANGLVTWDQIVGGNPDAPATASFNINCTLGSSGNNPIGFDSAYGT